MKNIKKPYFKKPIDSLYETMNDKGESVVRFRSNDNRERFIGTSLDPNKVPGGDTPSPSPMPSGGGMEEVTWQELKDKRDNGELNAGSLYRITDYNCTTTQESTQSAGHQFDIVLLALSENKLAEEGWAMMHDNVYDVTFADGVTKKCYIYEYTEGSYNVVEPDTLIGTSGQIGIEFVSIDDVNKVLICDPDYGPNSDGMTNEGLTYNYFQNSNLSAWKVWYCLDNDTARFVWADDSITVDEPASIVHDRDGLVYERYSASDTTDSGTQYYAWKNGSTTIFTNTLTPGAMNAETYRISPFPADDGAMITYDIVRSYTPAKSHPNGKGVIWRMIDELMNDVGYDFKNIQFVRPMTDGEYDPDEGEDTWVYTFARNHDGTIVDATIPDVDGNVWSLHNIINIIFELRDNVIFGAASDCHVDFNSSVNTIINGSIILLCCSELVCGEDGQPAIYLNNKKVLTEE